MRNQSDKPSLDKIPSPTMQSHGMVVVTLSQYEKRKHRWEDVRTAESLRLVTGLPQTACNNEYMKIHAIRVFEGTLW